MIRNLYILALIFIIPGISGCSRNKADVPILLLATDANFGTYAGEILRAEGFNAFKTDSLTGANITTAYLRQFGLVILAETKVSLYGVEGMLTENRILLLRQNSKN